MPGRDPGIHLLKKMMDCRVSGKPCFDLAGFDPAYFDLAGRGGPSTAGSDLR